MKDFLGPSTRLQRVILTCTKMDDTETSSQRSASWRFTDKTLDGVPKGLEGHGLDRLLTTSIAGVHSAIRRTYSLLGD